MNGYANQLTVSCLLTGLNDGLGNRMVNTKISGEQLCEQLLINHYYII